MRVPSRARRVVTRRAGRRRGLGGRAGLAPLAAAARALALRRLVGLQHRRARLVAGILEARPPVDERGGRLAALRADRQEIIGGAKARMLEEAGGPRAGALLEARLQRPDLLDRRLEAARDRDTRSLGVEHLVHR